jgi:hypothetical protein
MLAHDNAAEQTVTLDEAQVALMRLYEEELAAIKEKVDNAFNDFNRVIGGPEEERKPFAATLPGLLGTKSFQPWIGEESTRNMQAAPSLLTYQNVYDAETRQIATRIIQDVIVGLKNALVQTAVDMLRIEFYPQHRMEDGEMSPPWFKVELTVVTVISWENPSCVESDETDSEAHAETPVIDQDDALGEGP